MADHGVSRNCSAHRGRRALPLLCSSKSSGSVASERSGAGACRQVDPRALTECLIPKLPYFMVPRYIRVVAEIPKTETNKPRKVIFRDEGVTPDTWDREKAGIKLHRDKL